MANGLAQSNVVYLLDEPGISLHVNAQKELLKLFDHLASKGNQIIYSTNLSAPLLEWNVLTNDVHYAHTIASDGRIVIIDDTENKSEIIMVQDMR